MTTQHIKIPPKTTSAKAISLILALIINGHILEAKKIAEIVSKQIKEPALTKIIHTIMIILKSSATREYIEMQDKNIFKNRIAEDIGESLKNQVFDTNEKNKIAEIIFDLAETGQQDFAGILNQAIKNAVTEEKQELYSQTGDALYKKIRKYMEERKFSEAIKIIETIPPEKRNKDIWMNMAMAATMEEKPKIMREGFEKAASLSPANPLTLGQWGLGELFVGDIEDGLKLYECRKWLNSRNHKTPSQKPEWNGAPFPGQTLFVYQELGFGDAVQFARYIPRIRENAYPKGKIILGCHPKIKPLFQMMPDIDEVVDFEAGNIPPNHDMHASLFSMPFIFDRNFDGMPIQKPYFSIKGEKIKKNKKKQIGILWHSSTSGGPDKNIPNQTLHILKNAKNTQFFSLQFEKERNDEIKKNPDLDFINTTLKPWDMDFLDLAKAIHQLDAIISIDTAAIHIAGAMFKTAFLILPVRKRADWRWRKGVYKKSWYPSLTVIHQKNMKQWETPLKKVVDIINADKTAKVTKK